MRKYSGFLVLAVVIGLGVWGWFIFFPGPEKAIRSRLRALRETASFEKEGLISQAYNAQKLSEFFTTNAVISVATTDLPLQTLSGRIEIQQAALAARRSLRGLKVEFLDINVMVSEDKQTATVNLTGKATVTGEREYAVHEFNFFFRKVNGSWLIYRIETVKTLATIESPALEIGILLEAAPAGAISSIANG